MELESFEEEECKYILYATNNVKKRELQEDWGRIQNYILR